MLFPLFLLSLLQLLVLPGFLLHRLLGLRLRGLESAVGIAVLTLIGNYVLMHGTVAPLLGTIHLPGSSRRKRPHSGWPTGIASVTR
jgi:hypothetical protein